MNCPCHSQRPFETCCEPLIAGREPASSAEALMRSRYTAFTRGDSDYIDATWHPDFRPADNGAAAGPLWLGLDVIAHNSDGDHATVEFEARFLAGGQVNAHHEKSDFVLQQGRWYYTRGDLLPPSFKPWKPSRNAPCPCGSGVKFKRCCYARQNPI